MAVLSITFRNLNHEAGLPADTLELYVARDSINTESPGSPTSTLASDSTSASVDLATLYPGLMPGERVFLRIATVLGLQRSWSPQVYYDYWPRSISLEDGALTTSDQVDDLLNTLQAGNLDVGVIDLTNQPAPGQAGLDAAEALRTRGWVVMLNHPYWTNNLVVDSSYTQNQLDTTLQALVDNGISGGVLDLTGATVLPSSSGNSSLDTLKGRGWTIAIGYVRLTFQYGDSDDLDVAIEEPYNGDLVGYSWSHSINSGGKTIMTYSSSEPSVELFPQNLIDEYYSGNPRDLTFYIRGAFYDEPSSFDVVVTARGYASQFAYLNAGNPIHTESGVSNLDGPAHEGNMLYGEFMGTLRVDSAGYLDLKLDDDDDDNGNSDDPDNDYGGWAY